MAGFVELSGGAQAGGAGADDGDFLAGAGGWRLGFDPAFEEGLVDDVLLDELDGDGFFVDAQDATFLAGRGADPAGEFGEVVGLVEHVEGFAPAVFVNQIVPLGDDVAQRAAVVAERNAAVHAASALVAQLLGRHVEINLVPVQHAQLHRPTLGHLAGDLFEAGGLSHSQSGYLPQRRSGRREKTLLSFLFVLGASAVN